MKSLHSHSKYSLRTFALLVITQGLLSLTSCQESKTERFERETAEYTKKNCPQRIGNDDVIVLDSLVFHDDGTLNYINYYSVNADSAEVEYLISQKETLRQSLLNGIINSVELKNVKASGLNIIHRYYTADTHEEIFEFTFTSEDYR